MYRMCEMWVYGGCSVRGVPVRSSDECMGGASIMEVAMKRTERKSVNKEERGKCI